MRKNRFARLASFFKKGAKEAHTTKTKKPMAQRPFGKMLMTLVAAGLLAGAITPLTAQPAQAQSGTSAAISTNTMITWFVIYAVILSDSPEKAANAEFPSTVDFKSLGQNIAVNTDSVSALWYENGQLKIADSSGSPIKVQMSSKEAIEALDKLATDDSFIRLNDTTLINTDTASTLSESWGNLRLMSGSDTKNLDAADAQMQSLFKKLTQKEGYTQIDDKIVNLKHITQAYNSGLGTFRYKIAGNNYSAHIGSAAADNILKQLATQKGMINLGESGVLNIHMADHIRLDGNRIKARLQNKNLREAIDTDKIKSVTQKIIRNEAFIQIDDNSFINPHFHDDLELKGDIIYAKTNTKRQKYSADPQKTRKAIAKLAAQDKFFSPSKDRLINLSSIDSIASKKDGSLRIHYSKGSRDIDISRNQNNQIFDSLAKNDRFFIFNQNQLINKNAVKDLSFAPANFLNDARLKLTTKNNASHIKNSSLRQSQIYMKILADKYPQMQSLNNKLINTHAAPVYTYKYNEITFSYGKRTEHIKTNNTDNANFIKQLEARSQTKKLDNQKKTP